MVAVHFVTGARHADRITRRWRALGVTFTYMIYPRQIRTSNACLIV
jgi:hypothetical protein